MNLKLTGGVALTLGAGACLNAGAADGANRDKKDRPLDIAVLIADDWGWPYAGAYGDGNARTPTFDRIASEGMLFDNAYCAAPTSAASRAGILTGCYPHSLREAANLRALFPSDLQVYPSVLEQHGYRTALEDKGWGPGVFSRTGWEHNPAGWSVKDLAAFIEETPEDIPICVWLGSHRPHRPYKVGDGVSHGYSPEDLNLSENLPDEPQVRGDFADYFYNIERFDKRCADIVAALERSGRLDNCLLIIISDNGYPFPRAKATLYDEGCHIPMAVRWKGVTAPGSRCRDFVNLIDICATIYEATGITPEKPVHAMSLVPALKGGKARDEVFLERERHTKLRENSFGYPCRSVRNHEYHYILNLRPERTPAGDYPKYSDIDEGPAKFFMIDHQGEYPELFERSFGQRPKEELYDIRKDPFMTKNLANDRKYFRVLSRMRKKVQVWMHETQDPRTDPECDVFDYYPYVR